MYTVAHSRNLCCKFFVIQILSEVRQFEYVRFTVNKSLSDFWYANCNYLLQCKQHISKGVRISENTNIVLVLNSCTSKDYKRKQELQIVMNFRFIMVALFV